MLRIMETAELRVNCVRRQTVIELCSYGSLSSKLLVRPIHMGGGGAVRKDSGSNNASSFFEGKGEGLRTGWEHTAVTNKKGSNLG